MGGLPEQVALVGFDLALYRLIVLAHLFCNFHGASNLSVQHVTARVKQHRCVSLRLLAYPCLLVILSLVCHWRLEIACILHILHLILRRHFESDIDLVNFAAY